MLLRGRQDRKPLGGRSLSPGGPVEAVEQARAHTVLRFHQRHGLVLIERRLAASAGFGVGRQRLLEFGGQPQIIHHQPAGLVLENAIDARDGLHQAMAAHGFVDIHGRKAGRVEAGQPHVAHDDEAEGIGWVAEAFGQFLAPRLVADMGLPIGRIGRRAGHDHLHDTRAVVLFGPFRAQQRDLIVERHHDAPAHGHDHGLAFHDRKPRFIVIDKIAGDKPQALLGADQRLELRPFALQLFLPRDLFVFGDLLEFGIDLRLLRGLERQLGEPALVVDRHGGAVGHGALDVIDTDVVTEHGNGTGVLLLDGRAGEADEGGVGQRVAHVRGEAVNEIVLAAVGLVRQHHDVAPFGQERVLVALLFGEEFVDCGEHHAAGGNRELPAQVGAIRRLHRRLAQKVLAARERAEELIVQIVAVGEHDDGGVLHRGLQNGAAGIERHGQALA